MGLLLSYGTWSMPLVPIDVTIEHCAKLGYDGLSMAVKPGWTTDAATLDAAERRRILGLFDQHNMELCAISGQTSLLETDPEVDAENMAAVHRYIDLTAELQRPGHHLPLAMTAGGPFGGWESVKARLVERFGELAQHGELAGVTVMAEPNVGGALLTPEQSLWLLEQVNSPALKIDLDTSHFHAQGMDIDPVIDALGPHTAHVEVKDERGIAPNHEFLIPGEGPCDYVKILRALERVGYDGFVDVEISFMVQRRPNYDALAAATQSYTVLSRAFEAAGIMRERRPR